MSLLRRLAAISRGYVALETLEARRRAGAGVYRAWAHLEQQHPDPWALSPQAQLHRLCVWNAFTLQSLADAMLEADERLEPSFTDFVPPQTYELLLRFYQAAQRWLEWAQQNPCVPLAELPAGLPSWQGSRRYPRVFLEALLEAAEALRLHVEAVWAGCEQQLVPQNQAPLLKRLRQKRAKAENKLAYARRLLGHASPPSVGPLAVQHIRLAVGGYFRLGQLLAMPSLLDEGKESTTQEVSRVEVRERLLLPDLPAPSDDPWRMTDPQARPRLEQDLAAQAAIRDMWASDPDPKTTQALFEQLQEALQRNLIAYALSPEGRPLGPHRSPPFAAVYVALEPLKLWGQTLHTGELFSLEVYRPPRGGPFRRALVVFGPTNP